LSGAEKVPARFCTRIIRPVSLAPGDRLGPFEIVGPIGAGGMGEVYKARDTRLDRTVAIKKSNERFSDRFEREARNRYIVTPDGQRFLVITSPQAQDSTSMSVVVNWQSQVPR
jgi:serine/threonine protein kinase